MGLVVPPLPWLIVSTSLEEAELLRNDKMPICSSLIVVALPLLLHQARLVTTPTF